MVGSVIIDQSAGAAKPPLIRYEIPQPVAAVFRVCQGVSPAFIFIDYQSRRCGRGSRRSRKIVAIIPNFNPVAISKCPELLLFNKPSGVICQFSQPAVSKPWPITSTHRDFTRPAA